MTYSAKSEIRDPIKLFSEMAADAWQGRQLAWRLFLRNIRGLYRQTLLGLFWAFLPPIANTAVWIFLRSQGVFDTGEMEVNATLYILTGMILWQAFSDALQMPTNVFNQNKNMIGKLRFPRESLLLVGLGEILFDLLIRTVLLVAACAWYGQLPTLAWIPAALSAMMMVLLAMSLGLLLMPIGSLYQDVGRFLQMAMPFWMIVTPIIYVAPKTFPGSLLTLLNPAGPFLMLSRDLLIMGSSNAVGPALIWTAITLPLMLVALAVFRIAIPLLVERIGS